MRSHFDEFTHPEVKSPSLFDSRIQTQTEIVRSKWARSNFCVKAMTGKVSVMRQNDGVGWRIQSVWESSFNVPNLVAPMLLACRED
jgi:hypothetical protein